MSLLDSNIQVISGTEKKHSWKERVKGFNHELELKDQNGKDVGIFELGNTIEFGHNLWDSEGNELLRFFSGAFRMNKLEVWNPDGNMLWKVNRKMGWKADSMWMEDLEENKILECKSGLTCSIVDQNKKEVAEIQMKRWKKDFTLNIIDTKFDRLTIFGFCFAVLIFTKFMSTSHGNP